MNFNLVSFKPNELCATRDAFMIKVFEMNE